MIVPQSNLPSSDVLPLESEVHITVSSVPVKDLVDVDTSSIVPLLHFENK